MNKKFESKTRLNKTVCLKNEMDSFMKHIGLDEKLQDLKILDVWEKCVGSVLAKYSAPEHFNKNKLFVKVENSEWRSALFLNREEIICKLNKSLNKKVNKIIIKEIVFI